MDADGGAEWMTGPIGEPQEQMDTREAGDGDVPPPNAAQHTPGIPGL